MAVERGRYDVVLLDEYQDTGTSQRVLLSSLFGGGHPCDRGRRPVPVHLRLARGECRRPPRFGADFARRRHESESCDPVVPQRRAILPSPTPSPRRCAPPGSRVADLSRARPGRLRRGRVRTRRDVAAEAALGGRPRSRRTAGASPRAKSAVLTARAGLPAARAGLACSRRPGRGRRHRRPVERPRSWTSSPPCGPSATPRRDGVVRLLGAGWRLGPRDLAGPASGPRCSPDGPHRHPVATGDQPATEVDRGR